jgi:thiamine pyrophosphokinase
MLYGLVFANGDLNDGPAVRAVLNAPTPRRLIAVDGGLRHVLALGLSPDLVIGDMDSAEPADLSRVPEAAIKRFSPHKDETDLELALIAAAEQGCDTIRVLAAVGDRLDQTISNIYLLALPALWGRDARLVSGAQTSWLAHPGTMTVSGAAGDTLSLIPLTGEVTAVVTHGLEYPLRREDLYFGPARGVSNVLIGPTAEVSFSQGILLVVHTIGRA